MTDPGGARGDDPTATSVHVRQAKSGDRASVGWLVERFGPLLLAQARYRLGDRLRAVCEPEDLVNETWFVALPRLPDLHPRDGRETPVLLRFLTTTLLNLVNNLARRHIRARRAGAPGPAAPSENRERLAEAHAAAAGMMTEVATSETARLVLAALEELDPRDREVLVLRGLEQMTNAAVAELLGETPNAVSLRYNRAVGRLRERLPRSVFDELTD